MTPIQSPVSKHRLEALSDGVYAIALTLLVLELKLPALPHPVTDSLLFQALRAIVPKALTWLLSFWIIALFWLAQQRLLRLASVLSPRLSFIELLHLSLISLFPFSTALLGEYARHKPAAVIYAAHLLLIALVSWWRMAYFVGHTELHGPDVSPTVVRDESESLAAHGLLTRDALSGLRRAWSEYAGYAANTSYAQSWRLRIEAGSRTRHQWCRLSDGAQG